MFQCVVVLILLARAANARDCCEAGEELQQRNSSWWCTGADDSAERQPPITCAGSTMVLVPSALIPFEVSPEGHLDFYDGNLYLSRVYNNEFCWTNKSGENMSAPNASVERVPLVCYEEEPERQLVAAEAVAWCMVFSALFFALTGILYAALPELRDLQGKSIINLCLCFTIAFCILAGMNIMDTYEDMNLCAARGMLSYFFIIAGFFWMNSIAVQFLMSIRWPSSMHERGWKPLVWFAAYSWGGAALLAVLVALVNFNEGRHPKPGIGLQHCWFLNATQQWIYLYSVMTLVIVINVSIFVYASTLLWKHSLRSTNVQLLRFRFTMMSRLFILLGLPWIFEMIQAIVPKHFILELLDLFIALQGLLIFCVLVLCRARALKALAGRRACSCLAPALQALLAATADFEAEPEHTRLDLTCIDSMHRDNTEVDIDKSYVYRA